MLANMIRNSPAPISAVALVAGFLLMTTGRLPLGIVGAVLILLAFLVPFVRLGVISDRNASDPTPMSGRSGFTGGSVETSLIGDIGYRAPQSESTSVPAELASAFDDFDSAIRSARRRRRSADIDRAERALEELHAINVRGRRAGSSLVSEDLLAELKGWLDDLKAELREQQARDQREGRVSATVDG